MNDLVSVIIPTYKRPSNLKKSINSVLKQTYKNIEIIVVDDNDPNSDARAETEQIMKDFIDYSNISYIRHPRNLNGSVARNTGIKNASGKYIAFLDNDDEYLEDKIELQEKKLNELGESYGIVYTKFVRKKFGKIIDKGIEDRTGNLTLEILKGTFYISAGSNILIRRSIVDQLNGFNEQFLRRQDLEFLIRASLLTKIAHVDKVCLLINKDDPTNANALTREQLNENADTYLNSFSQYINTLSKTEREQIFISQGLQKIRYYALKGHLLQVKKIANEKNIKYTVVLKYFCYLFKRKIFKECYGFNF